MAWVDLPIKSIKFGFFEPNPTTATVSVAQSDLRLFRYKMIGTDTVVVDFRIGKAFFNPSNVVASGITMELTVPFASVYVPAIGTPSSFNDGGQTYSNDCILALDPGGVAHAPGCVAVLNESTRKVVLLVRNVAGDNINGGHLGVIGFFGQITFEIAAKRKGGIRIGATTSRRGGGRRAR
ncbi:MAG TPA: hypothetical protein VFA27_10785 [Vicinamibacterales bacterium]|nr:hypothetical protein [Vicinamibacterales bacterium]